MGGIMRRVAVLLAALLAAMAFAGCSSGSEPRAEPFVGQWESTGGQAIQMTVTAPADGIYPVRIVGGSVDLSLEAEKTGDNLYEATPDTGSVWTFRLTDEELLTATAQVGDQAPVSTSFKRTGE